MTNYELYELLKNILEVRIDAATNGLTLVVPGGELIFHEPSNHGSGEWYFNDTAD